MRIWVIKDGELLPFQADGRLMRTGMLARELVARGHDVTWWSTTFSHQHKRLLRERGTDIEMAARYRVRLLHAGLYRRNVSVTRYLHHWRAGVEFRRQARIPPPPDVIVTAFPTIDLAFEAVRYGRSRGVPVIVDVRDPWPDVFVQKSRRAIRPLIRIGCAPAYHRARYALRHASSIVATSHGYLRWAQRHGARNVDLANVFYIGSPRLSAPADRKSGEQDAAPDRPVTVTYIGSFGESYELSLICDAAGHLHDNPKVKFVIAGDGQQRSFLENRIGTLSNVTLLPWQDAVGARRLLESSDVGLVPCVSARDTMPNKAFEYLAAGLPLLSSLEGEMETLLEQSQAGLSYRCGDASDLVRQLRRLLDDGTRKQMASNASALFDQRCAADDIYRKYAEHVENIASAKHSRPSGSSAET
jgi:glycosyltransferase involved in cell wall biosynthesis